MAELITNKKIFKKNILRFGICFFVIFIISGLLEFGISRILYMFLNHELFYDYARFWFFVGLMTAILLCIFVYKKFIQRVEVIFLFLALIIGSSMILCAPFGHICFDLESHFKFVLSLTPNDGTVTGAEEFFCEDGTKTIYRASYNSNNEFREEVNNLDNTVVEKTYNAHFQLSHLPGTIIYSLGKLMGLPFSIRIDLIRFLYLFLYSIICYFAIKKLKSNKLIFLVIALFPSNLFLASNITYDWWVTSFIMLGIAYFISEMQQPSKPIALAESCIMCGSLMLGCLPKQIYFPLLLIPFILKKDIFKDNRSERFKHYSVAVIFILVLLISLFFRLPSDVSSGDMRGGEGVSSPDQIMFILSHPLTYIKILFRYLLDYLSIGNFLYTTSNFSEITNYPNLHFAKDFGAFIILLIVCVIFDHDKVDKYTCTWKNRILVSTIVLVTIILICTALYVSFTPVGALTIEGCQARYLTPLLIPIMPLFGNRKIANYFNKKNFIFTITLLISIFTFWDIASTMLVWML